MSGKLFVIDGTDGSGKQTQFERLKERLTSEGVDYRTVSFPNYNSPSSSLVKMYLSGEFGDDAQAISPYVASTFFAADRYATFKKDYEEYYKNGGIILADRYTTANMVHQAGKIKNKQERNEFMKWLWDLEFNKFGLPVPTRVFFLDMPIEYSMQLMQNRKNKFTHEDKKDIHEANIEHLKDAYSAALEVAKEYNWYKVNCIKGNEIRPIDDIHEEIYGKVYQDILKKEIAEDYGYERD